MKISLIKGRGKAAIPILLYLIPLAILIYRATMVTYVEWQIISTILLVAWIFLGIFMLWIFIPQWDPWLRLMKKSLKGSLVVALTFDDGPEEPWTSKVLDILKEQDVRATFFVVGKQAEKFPHLVRRAVDEGHIVGGHTSTHRILTFVNPAERLKEIESSIKMIEKITGCRPNFFRLPHGFKFPGMYRTLKEWDLIPIPWTKGIWDTDMPSEDELLKRFSKKFHPFEILLLHDGISYDDPQANRDAMVSALPKMIEEYKRMGYTFTTLADLRDCMCRKRK